MKYVHCLTVFLLLIGCSEKPKHSDFSYQEAIALFQNEIKKMEDGPMKNVLLWNTERILDQDTLYEKKLGSSMYDSLMSSINDYNARKHFKRQLHLDQLEQLTIADRMEVYKFHYSRAFSRDLVIVTVSKQEGGQGTITWQVLEVHINSDHNAILSDRFSLSVKLNESRPVSDREWNTLVKLIDETKFWELPSKVGNYGLDGSSWVVEGSKRLNDSSMVMRQIYHSVDRWTPEEGTPIYKIGRYLLSTKDYDWGKIY